MPIIEPASKADGPSILKMTADTGIFTPTEIECVQELWNAYLHDSQASGYSFLAYREDG